MYNVKWITFHADWRTGVQKYEKYKRISASKNLSHHKGAMKQLFWPVCTKGKISFTWFFLSRFLFVAFVGIALRTRDCKKGFAKLVKMYLTIYGTKWDQNQALWRYCRSFLISNLPEHQREERERAGVGAIEKEVQLHQLMRKLNRLLKFIQYLSD